MGKLYISKKNQVFFNENGLTSTAANSICNKAKELIKDKQAFLSNVKFYSESVGLISSDSIKIVGEGMHSDDFYKIIDIIQDIAQINAMIAWIKEGIKAKNEVISYYNIAVDEIKSVWMKENGIKELKMPSREKHIINNDVIGEWPIDKRNKYYALEVYCALVGKYIHPNGAFYEAKQMLDKVVNNPNRVDGEGRDAIVHTFVPSVKQDMVKNMYVKMAEDLRHKEAELNQMKQEINDKVSEYNLKIDSKYNKEYREYLQAYNNIDNDFNIYLDECKIEASKLKIFLPEGPKEIYDKINNI